MAPGPPETAWEATVSASADRRIPVVLLAGFLGSGKTTLLNHLLLHSDGTRIGALVNDFGSIEIDAMTVAGQVDSMVSLGDGCLCCAVDTSDIDDALERLAGPSVGMDLIVIEASGLAEPETLIRMILASRSEHIRYGGLVEVVDAAEFESTSRRHPELERHLRAADLVVLNKVDRADGMNPPDSPERPEATDPPDRPSSGESSDRADGTGRLDVTDGADGTGGADGRADRTSRTQSEVLGERVRRLSPGTPVVRAAYGRIDPQLLFDPARRERPEVEQLSFEALLRESEQEDHSAHPHATYESVEFTSARPLGPRRFLDFLDGRPAGVYRIKGFVDFGAADPARRYAVHTVGGFLRFAPSPWAAGEERLTRLVLIGSGIDADALRRGLERCVAEGDEGDECGGEREMWGVLRYVEGERHGEPADAENPREPDWEGDAGIGRT